MQPTASDSSNYAYGTDHALFEGKYITPTQEVNRVQVLGDAGGRYKRVERHYSSTDDTDEKEVQDTSCRGSGGAPQI